MEPDSTTTTGPKVTKEYRYVIDDKAYVLLREAIDEGKCLNVLKDSTDEDEEEALMDWIFYRMFDAYNEAKKDEMFKLGSFLFTDHKNRLRWYMEAKSEKDFEYVHVHSIVPFD
jgi:hypothetical protein